MALLELNNSNYYSDEANQQYMSVSQYKDFLKCEAAALAKTLGWREPSNDALIFGSYVHSWLEGEEAFEEFKASNPNLYSSRGPTKGELKSEYSLANKMIESLRNDAFCMYVLGGEKERIMTAEFAGAIWKAKIDVYNSEAGRIADLKTTKSIREKVWSSEERRYVSFVEAYGYTTQMAVYCEIESIITGRNGWCEPLIVAVSKEDVPDKEVIGIDEYRLELELEVVHERMPRILEVKRGLDVPERCEKCRYCRETKELTRVVHFSELVS